MDEGDRNAEHGEKVDVVDGAVERINTPCRGVVDQVVSCRAFAIGLFAYKSLILLVTVSRVLFRPYPTYGRGIAY